MIDHNFRMLIFAFWLFEDEKKNKRKKKEKSKEKQKKIVVFFTCRYKSTASSEHSLI